MNIDADAHDRYSRKGLPKDQAAWDAAVSQLSVNLDAYEVILQTEVPRGRCMLRLSHPLVHHPSLRSLFSSHSIPVPHLSCVYIYFAGIYPRGPLPRLLRLPPRACGLRSAHEHNPAQCCAVRSGSAFLLGPCLSLIFTSLLFQLVDGRHLPTVPRTLEGRSNDKQYRNRSRCVIMTDS
jgi:hypothetical protein